MRNKYIILLLLALGTLPARGEVVRRLDPPASAPAAPVIVKERPLSGIFIGVLAPPVPSIYGINIGFQRTRNVRFTTGLGLGSGVTIGGGAEYTFLPKSFFSPVGHIGLALLFTDAADLGRYYSNAFDKPVKSNTHISIIGSVGGGVEMQTRKGFRAGVGLNMGVFSGLVIVPYARVGYFFF